MRGVVLKQVPAREAISRWNVIETYRRATSVTAMQFLVPLQCRMPVPIRAIQVDGGSEVTASFEQACQQQGIRLVVLPPRSPKLNGAVERANRTHTEEFYESYTGKLDLPMLRAAQRRPHQALGYLTPAEFLKHHATQRPPSHKS
jgi:putative transposase